MSVPNEMPEDTGAEMLDYVENLYQRCSDPIDDLWSVDDYMYSTVEQSRALLKNKSLSPLPRLDGVIDAVQSIGEVIDDEATIENENSKIAIDDLEEDLIPYGFTEYLLQLLQAQKCVLLLGAARCGKSYFLRNIFSTSTKVRNVFPRIMYVNCKALGVRHPMQLQKDIISAQFGIDDDAFQRFYKRFSEGYGDEYVPIVKYLERRFSGGSGLVILDHYDSLSEDLAIQKFVSNNVVGTAERLGVSTLFIQRNIGCEKIVITKSIDKPITFPQYTLSDIGIWLVKLEQRIGVNTTLNSVQVVREIGARVELLQEFASFIGTAKYVDSKTLDQFVTWRSRIGHLPDCDRFLRKAREYPNFLMKLIKADGVLTQSVVDCMSKTCLRDICDSGTVYVQTHGISYASCLHEQRIHTLLQSDALIALTIRGTEHNMLENGSWKYLKSAREFSADSIRKTLAAEPTPTVALKRFQRFLLRWGADTELFIRDPINSRLWAPFSIMDALAPFRGILQPEFSRAIQQGSTVHCQDGRWFIPVFGTSGYINMVVCVTLVNAKYRWFELSQIRALQCFIGSLQTTLAHIIHRLVFKFEKDLISATANRTRDEKCGHNGLLYSFGCVGWAILHRDENSKQWYASKIESIRSSERSIFLSEIFSDMQSNRLDGINQHQAKHGLVMKDDQLIQAFPRLKKSSDAVYVQPITGNKVKPKLVVFVFDGEVRRSTSGFVQQRLEIFATDIAAA